MSRALRQAIAGGLSLCLVGQVFSQAYKAKYLPKPDFQRVAGERRATYTLPQMKDLLKLDSELDYLKQEVERLREISGLRRQRLVLRGREMVLGMKLTRYYEGKISDLEADKQKLVEERNHFKYKPRLAAHWKAPLIIGFISIIGGVALLLKN